MNDLASFRGRNTLANAPLRVLYRFTKPGGHRAEICERQVTTFRAIECIVFVNGSLIEIELFHDGREAEYPSALAARVQQFLEGDWVPSDTTDGKMQN
jgi:hypothetical protein